MELIMKNKLLHLFLFQFFSCCCFGQQRLPDEEQITSLIGQMSLEEKVNMIHANGAFSSGGVSRLGIPDFVMSDGPHGVRREIGKYWEYYKQPLQGALDSSTYLPVGICLGATWNPGLALRYGKVLGSEANFRKKHVILGPGINIIRTPLNGRNFEYESEDPFLVSKIVVPYIQGVQSEGVSACVKHFAANNQEVDRMSVNVEMNERALREIYLPGFKAAVEQGRVNLVMGAYNKFRGQYATHNESLVKKILKGEWNFDGVMTSDWGAARNTREALLNGLDIEMGTDINMGPHPQSYNYFKMADTLVIPLIKSGAIPESIVDEKIRRILRVMFRTNLIQGASRVTGQYNTRAHQQVALDVASEGIVLLKNKRGILPLDKSKIRSVAVIGANADRKNAYGGGSSQVNAKYEISPLEGLRRTMGNDVKISFTEGYRVSRAQDPKADSLLKEAVALASAADVVIFVGGWTNKNTDSDRLFLDAETVDKPNMDMPFEQDRLINALTKVNRKTIVALIGGSAVNMGKWVNEVDGILQLWYPGMEGGNAFAGIVTGKINPSGKLPVTFAKKIEDVPAHKLGEYPGTHHTVHYNEGIYVGYRYFDTFGVKPQFAFGHGLSYTTFKYEKMKLVKGEGNTVNVFVTLRNSGSVSGAEVVQVYVRDEQSTLERPFKELKGFEKVFLKPGESRELMIKLDEDAFRFYHDKENKWVLEPGIFNFMVGGGSDDIRLRRSIRL